MPNPAVSTISTQLCIGILITSEIHMHLSKSTTWKVAHIQALPGDLSIIPYKGKNYLGCYLPEQQSLGDVEKITDFIKNKFRTYCPHCNAEETTICVFAQVLIA